MNDFLTPAYRLFLEQELKMSDIPLGIKYGDGPNDLMTHEVSPLHKELSPINLKLWRTMNRVVGDLLVEFDLANELLGEDPCSSYEVYTRLLQTDSLLLTWFISSGRLEELYNLRKESLSQRGVNEDEIEARIQLCFTFLERMRERNREVERLKNKYTPTIGLELEIACVENQLAENNLEFYSNPKRVKPVKVPYEVKAEVNNNIEYVFCPTASVKTLIRHVLYLKKMGLHPSKDFYHHVTVGGLKLSPDHLEAAYIQTIVCGCCYANPPSAHFIQMREENGPFSVTTKETYKKFSIASNFILYYFPFLRLRESDTTINYSLINKHQQCSVEFRLASGILGLDNLFREVDAIYYLSVAAIAYQKSFSERDDVEQKLAYLWVSLVTKIEEIFWSISLDYSSGLSRSVFYLGENNFDEGTKNLPYNKMLFELRYQSATNSKLKFEIRRLVRQTKHSIKEAIGTS